MTASTQQKPLPAGKSKQSLVERAYESIKKRILDNHYYPGYQALEKDVAEDLGMT